MSKYIYLLKMSTKFNKIRLYDTPEITASLDFIGQNIMLLRPRDLSNYAFALSKTKLIEPKHFKHVELYLLKNAP